MPRRRVNLGRLGEQQAVDYLQKQNYQILARNFHARIGEIDIVASDGRFLIFVEVKARRGQKCGQPEEAVTPHKLASIMKAAQYFKKLHPQTPALMRVDVIAIEFDASVRVRKLRHFKNITR